MATWAYPPLPADQIGREADTALVRKRTFIKIGGVWIPPYPIYMPTTILGS
jgi:hypothetical protein